MPYRIEVATPGDLGEIIRVDDDATSLYAERGVIISFAASHPFAVDEQARWRRSAELGRLFFALSEGERFGFAALDRFDGVAYLDKLSVKRSAMRRGAGRYLLRHAIAWARANCEPSLWLTTYGHLPWNRPFYESEGFVVMPEPECPHGVRHHIDEQRLHLPEPGERVAMRRVVEPG